MAAAEARAMLDALMGGERNAPLPPGAAMPHSKKRRKLNNNNDDLQLQLPGKRSKSCFDSDICPLYCAWGIDVFELFVNTKSDIGPNPYVVDDGARSEYLQLPAQEQQRLGFDYFLFQKLQELVRSGDRIVARNKDKLAQELRRLAAKRGGSQPVVDYVQDVDEQLLEALARNQVEMEAMKEQLEQEWLPQLEEVQAKEDALKEELSPLLEAQRAKRKKKEEQDKPTEDTNEEDEHGDEKVAMKNEAEGDDDNDNQGDGTEGDDKKFKVKKEEEGDDSAAVKQEDATADNEENDDENQQDSNNPRIQELQTELGKTTMEKQRLLWDIAGTIGQLAPLQDTMDGQWRNLLYVKSDIAADKTVCEVSGNFMSARDADERIAAHYAGKQYVGWKLVRGKLKEMIAKYGKYGPPPPDRRGGGDVMGMRGGPPQRGGGGFGRGGGGGYGGGGGFGGGRGRGRFDGPPPGGAPFRGGPPGGDRRGGGGDRDRRRRRSPSPAWERFGPGGGPPRGGPPRGGGGGGWRR